MMYFSRGFGSLLLLSCVMKMTLQPVAQYAVVSTCTAYIRKFPSRIGNATSNMAQMWNVECGGFEVLTSLLNKPLGSWWGVIEI